jgi:hypothetical protein
VFAGDIRSKDTGPPGRAAAYNLETIRSFLTKKAAEAKEAEKPRPLKKRCEGTWRHVVAIRRETGPDPPPA